MHAEEHHETLGGLLPVAGWRGERHRRRGVYLENARSHRRILHVDGGQSAAVTSAGREKQTGTMPQRTRQVRDVGINMPYTRSPHSRLQQSGFGVISIDTLDLY